MFGQGALVCEESGAGAARGPCSRTSSQILSSLTSHEHHSKLQGQGGIARMNE